MLSNLGYRTTLTVNQTLWQAVIKNAWLFQQVHRKKTSTVCMIKTHGKYHLVCGYTLSTLLPFNKAFEKYMKTTNKYIKWDNPLSIAVPRSCSFLTLPADYNTICSSHCTAKKKNLAKHSWQPFLQATHQQTTSAAEWDIIPLAQCWEICPKSDQTHFSE